MQRSELTEMCVLRIKADVLDLPGAIISDQNASSDYAMFLPSPSELKKLLYDEVFARSWIYPNDQIREWCLGSVVCAELLIPSRLDPGFIFGIYVAGNDGLQALKECAPTFPSTVNSDIFL
jgi:ssDNA thymidine ADP-ribosyltransferase, DarT